MSDLLLRFPWVVATIAVAAAAAILTMTAGVRWSAILVAVFVLVVAGRSAWRMIQDLRRGRFGVDILAVTAIVAAVVVGEYWASLVVVLMLTTGEALEAYASSRARADLTALLSHQPLRAHRIVDRDEIEDVAVEIIVPGDQIVVRMNEVVPVDGMLLSPSGTFDDSSLTGESMPVDRSSGEEVPSGSVNGPTAVTLQVRRTAADSQYQQVVALVEEASRSRAPIVRVADRFALPFAVVAYAIAAIAWWQSGEPVRFVEVLVVATPCPLIIAAPVAFMAGMSRAARHGIILRSSATLETLHRTRIFAFDKTGTLTRGEPELVSVRTTHDQIDGDRLLALAASAEANSAHTLAAATVRAAEARGITIMRSEDAAEVTAAGVTAVVDGSVMAIGKRRFIAEFLGFDVSATPTSSGEIAVYVAADGRLAGALVFADEIRDNALSTIRRLRREGVREFLMLTGDDGGTARHVGSLVGIDDVRADCRPADKVAAVAAVAERPIAMVGDGVNDAPVLAAADVGIAMGARGATAASEAADVVILKDDISRVADTVAIARHTVGIALQSIWVGIGLSMGLMVIAAYGSLPAIAGAWVQEGVDVIVTLWALRAVGARASSSAGDSHDAIAVRRGRTKDPGARPESEKNQPIPDTRRRLR